MSLSLTGTGIRNVFATGLLILYEIFIIIVLFNLLIAIMNSTIQKTQDRRQLYWKYARTCVWIEFFDDSAALPLPFTIYNVYWAITITVGYLIKICLEWLFRKIKAVCGLKSKTSVNDQPKPCQLKPGEFEKRKAHTNLMLSLLKRYEDKCKEITEEVKRSDLEQMKMDLMRTYSNK